MGENVNSRIGFKGAEDLGNGLKAIFQLEKRFNVHDGTNNTGDDETAESKDWEGAANVGLASNNWGKIRFGRVNELTTETIRKFDPFYQYGIGGMIESTQRSARIDKTARYDSPKWNGFSFGLSYSLGENTKKGSYYADVIAAGGKPYDNDGYAINLSYDNGPFMATANWSRVADSNDSDVWNIGLAYKFGSARVMLSYEKTTDEGIKNEYEQAYDYYDPTTGALTDTDVALKSEQESWLLGLEWDIGPGQFDAAVQRVSLDDVRYAAAWDANQILHEPAAGSKAMKDADIMKYSIGYTYNLSKRTSVYGQVSYTDWDSEDANGYYGGSGRESTTGVQLGMTHKF